MVVLGVEMRDFRSYARAEAQLGEGLTVLHGANGAGKSNLIEAVYFGCTARSPRTRNEREVVRFGAQAARVAVRVREDGEEHELTVGYSPGTPAGRAEKRMACDGAPLERMLDAPLRPLVSFFAPDRLELLKGAPALRRGHLDQLVAALWPARADARIRYARVLAQRNALIARIRAGGASRSTLSTWDRELARWALELCAHRTDALDALARALRRARRRARLRGRGDARVPPAHERDRRGCVRRRARGASRARPRARVLHARTAPRRDRDPARRARAARVRLAGRTAPRAARAAARRARRARARAAPPR